MEGKGDIEGWEQRGKGEEDTREGGRKGKAAGGWRRMGGRWKKGK